MAKINEKIDLNNAGVALLTQLPGVAKNTAYEIVNYRTHHGGFSAWEGLEKLPSLPKKKALLAALQKAAFLGPRPAPQSAKQRRILTSRLGKSKDELHNHG